MYAAKIRDAGLPVAFVAEGTRAEELAVQGVLVNGEPLVLPVVSWEAAAPGIDPPERIIVAVKHQHLPEVCARIGTLAGPQTAVLSVMNGIESEELLQRALDGGRGGVVLPAMVAGMDAVRIRGAERPEVTYTRLGRVFFGGPPETVTQMQRFLQQAGIPDTIPPDIQHAIWNKFMLNVAINQWSAVLRAPYRWFHSEGSGRNLLRITMREILQVAQRRGVPLSEDDLEGWFEVIATLSPEGKTSMLQDIEAGRKTEVEMFALKVVEMGRELGIPTPVNEALFEAIRTIEGCAVGEPASRN